MDLRRLLIAGLVWLAGAGLAQAADVDDSVPGRADLTYFDLIRLVVTDLAHDSQGGASGHRIIDLRHIEGADQKADPVDPIVVGSIDAIAVPGDPGRLVVLADLGPTDGSVAEGEVLALFKVGAGAPRLLDAAEVGTDRLVGLRDAGRAMLAPGAPLILIDSEHDNSNQSYRSTEMIHVHRDRLRLIGSVFTFGDAGCSYKRTQTPTFSLLPGAGRYRTVHVKVSEEVTLTGQDCGADDRPPAAGVRIFQGRYVWDETRADYVAHAAELDRLAAEDAQRF